MQFWAVFKKKKKKKVQQKDICFVDAVFSLSFDKLTAIFQSVIKWTKRLLLLKVTADVMFYLWLDYHRNPRGELFSQLSQAVKSPLSDFYASHCPVLLSKTLLNMLCTIIRLSSQSVMFTVVSVTHVINLLLKVTRIVMILLYSKMQECRRHANVWVEGEEEYFLRANVFNMLCVQLHMMLQSPRAPQSALCVVHRPTVCPPLHPSLAF